MGAWDFEPTEISPTTPLSELVSWKPYTTSEDRRGHERFLGAKFPKNFEGMVTYLREQSGGTYRINADVVRDAIWLGLQIIALREKSNPYWPILVQMTQQRARALEKASIYRDMDALVDDLDKLCSEHDDASAQDVLSEQIELIDKLPNKAVYLTALREKLEKKRLTWLLKSLA